MKNWIRHVCYPEKEEALFYYVKINAIKKAWVTPNKQKLKQLTQQPPTNTEQELHPGNEAKEWNIGPKRSAVFFFGLSCARCNNCGSHEDKLVIGLGSLPFSFFFDMSQALPFSFDVELLEKFFFFQIAKASSPELGSQKEPGQQEQRSSNEWDSRDWSGSPNFFFFCIAGQVRDRVSGLPNFEENTSSMVQLSRTTLFIEWSLSLCHSWSPWIIFSCASAARNDNLNVQADGRLAAHLRETPAPHIMALICSICWTFLQFNWKVRLFTPGD